MQEQQKIRLAVYGTKWCPFCRRVWRVIDKLGVEVENRNINHDANWERELIEACGRRTVPVLRIMDENGGDRWMPESSDIMIWLKANYS